MLHRDVFGPGSFLIVGGLAADGAVLAEGQAVGTRIGSGVVRLYTEFYEPVEMAMGDSAYYDGSMGHCVVSVSQEDALILWVTSM